MKNIVIIGASGFIGQHLLKHYLDAGDNVTAVVPDPENLDDFQNEYKKLHVIKSYFEDFSSLSKKIHYSPIDIVYYLAWGGYGAATNDYVEQIKNIKPLCDAISETAKHFCKRFVFSTSFSEYMISDLQDSSHNQGAFCNVYGSAKHAARLMAQAVSAQNNITFISVAFANTFGPGDKSRRSTNLFLYKFLNNLPVDLTTGDHLYDWNYIDDTLNGLILAGEKGKGDSIYYIGNNERKPLRDIVLETRKILGSNSKINFGKYVEHFYVDYSCVDVHKLYRETGYLAKTSFEEAIKKTADWIKTIQWE